MQLGEIPPLRRTGSASEGEIDVEVEPRRIDPAEILAVEVAHPRVIGGRVEDVLVRRAAAVEVMAALVGEELNVAAKTARPRVGEGLMGRHVLHRKIDPRAGVGEHLVHGRGCRVAVALLARRAEVGRDRDRVERAFHALEDARRDPVVRRKTTRGADDPLVLP